MYKFYNHVPQLGEIINQFEPIEVETFEIDELNASSLSKAFIQMESQGFVVTCISMNENTMKTCYQFISDLITEDGRIWTAGMNIDNSLLDNEFSLYTDI